MAKPRKRKATTTSRKLKGAMPAKRSPSRRKPRAAPPAGDDDDDLDVFIPQSSGAVLTSEHPVQRQPAAAEWEDVGEVFVAQPGRPVEVQADWTQDAPTPLGISDDEFFASLAPRAMSPGGWTGDELQAHGMDVRRGQATCRYGCGGSTSSVPGVSSHRYDCQYWQREGKDRTPF